MTCIVLHSTGGGEGGAAKMSPPILKRLGIEKENFQIKKKNETQLKSNIHY